VKTAVNSNILLINTSSKKIEFAYNKKGDFCILNELDESKNADDLVFEIKAEFDNLGLCFQDIDYVGLLNGPGSYTGLRIGSAIAKAICFATGSDLVEIHSLDMIAKKFYLSYPNEENKVIPLIFSNMKTEEFYYAVYKDGFRVSEFSIAVLDEIRHNAGIFVVNEKTGFDFPIGMETVDLAEKSNINSLFRITEEFISEKKISDFRMSEPFYMKQFFGD
jgi:tRNA threonylcarbamoyladenosine biosynthesis protein TsaB